MLEGGGFDGRGARIELLCIAYCAGVKEGEDKGANELDDREQGGEGQVEEFDGLEVDFHFEGGELRTAEEKYDAKRGEVEEEDEERCGEDGGTKERDCYVCPNMDGVGSEGTGGRFEFGVEAGEGGPYDADDNGGVIEDVGKQDKDEG